VIDESADEKSRRSRALAIWHDPPRQTSGEEVVILWDSFEILDHASFISLPDYVERHAARFRERYLAWVEDLGAHPIGPRQLKEWLQLRPGLSYWWMTSVAERFNASGHSPIHDSIKLLALEELLTLHGITHVTLHSSNFALISAVNQLLVKMGLQFSVCYIDGERQAAVRGWRRWLPLPLQALLSFVHYVAQRRSPRKYRNVALRPSAGITFVDVLVHLKFQKDAPRPFRSNYWTLLVDELAESRVLTNWIHVYFKHGALRRFKDALEVIDEFNLAQPTERHLLLDVHLSWGAVVRALMDFCRLLLLSWKLPVDQFFCPKGSAVNLWALHRHEWFSTLRGPNAMVHCLELASIERLFAKAPKQRLGVYIQENQPWEMALVSMWKAHGHGTLIGVPHSTVRYWDLRYAYDRRAYADGSACRVPRPDLVAVNGPVAKGRYLEDGYPPNEIVEVEALRYMHLSETQPERGPPSEKLRVLICGDFLTSTTRTMLRWLRSAASRLPVNHSLTFKPHPAYPLHAGEYADIQLQSSDKPLSELLDDCDVVFASNITSAALDAYLRGVPVVQMLDGRTFNFSPLREMRVVHYVRGEQDLAPALIQAARTPQSPPMTYFHVDPALPRWRSLLR
jgi:surface carbohydrate biosynthesis protein (TIGR04326 family)